MADASHPISFAHPGGHPIDRRTPSAPLLCALLLSAPRMSYPLLAKPRSGPPLAKCWNGLTGGPVYQRPPIRPVEQQPTGQSGPFKQIAEQTDLDTKSDNQKLSNQ